MAFTIPDFRRLSPEETSPVYGAMMHGLDIFNKLQNAKFLPDLLKAHLAAAQLEAPNIENQMALRKAQIERQNILNQFLPEQSRIGLESESAQNALRKAQMEKLNYMLQHPGYMGGQSAKDIQYLVDMGLINPEQSKVPSPSLNNQPNNVPQETNINQPDNVQSKPSFYSGNKSAPFSTSNPLIDAILNKPFAATALKTKQAENYDFNSIPLDQRKYMFNMAAGMGVAPDEARKRFVKGETLEQMASSLGLDINQVEPNYLLSPTEVKQFKNRNSLKNELDKLENFTTKALGKYSGSQILSYSPKQIADYVLNLNKDKQAEFLAAYMAQPEISGLRLRLLQAPAGITALHEIMDRSYGTLKPFQAFGVSQDVFEKAQKIFNRELTSAVNAANTVYERPYVKGKAEINKIPGISSIEERRSAREKLNKESALLKQDQDYIESNLKPTNIGYDKKGRKIGYINGVRVFIE